MLPDGIVQDYMSKASDVTLSLEHRRDVLFLLGLLQQATREVDTLRPQADSAAFAKRIASILREDIRHWQARADPETQDLTARHYLESSLGLWATIFGRPYTEEET